MAGRFFYPIFHLSDSMLAGTMSTAIEDTIGFHAVTDDPATAVRAGGRQGVDGTFEAIEDMRLAVDPDFKTFVVHIPTDFTSLVILHLIHDLPLSDLAFFTGCLCLPDVLTSGASLRRSRLGLFRDVAASFRLKAISQHVHRL